MNLWNRMSPGRIQYHNTVDKKFSKKKHEFWSKNWNQLEKLTLKHKICYKIFYQLLISIIIVGNLRLIHRHSSGCWRRMHLRAMIMTRVSNMCRIVTCLRVVMLIALLGAIPTVARNASSFVLVAIMVIVMVNVSVVIIVIGYNVRNVGQRSAVIICHG